MPDREEDLPCRAQWLFSEEGLRRVRESAFESAWQVLREGGSGAGGSGVAGTSARLLGVSEGTRLVNFYARKLPGLCSLCGTPKDVLWTAVVLFQRFFAVKTPLEFDPLPMMFVSVLLACKIEEFHELSVEKIIEAAGLNSEDWRQKVLGVELLLLEGIGFALHVEPKPDGSLSALVEDIRECLHKVGGVSSEAAWSSVISSAHDRVIELCTSTDAVLRFSPSVLFASVLRSVIDSYPAWSKGEQEAAQEALQLVLQARLRPHSIHAQALISHAEALLGEYASSRVCNDAEVKDFVRAARRSHKIFERLREEAARLREVHRKERKRLWSEMKGGGGFQVPTPLLQKFAALNRECFASTAPRAKATEGSEEEFVLHRPRIWN